MKKIINNFIKKFFEVKNISTTIAFFMAFFIIGCLIVSIIYKCTTCIVALICIIIATMACAGN